MAAKIDIQEEIRKIASEMAAGAEKKALEVSTAATMKAAEVSSTAIAKALDVSTLAAQRAADAATAAATIATTTSKDLEYMRKDIAETKADVKEIKNSLTDKFVEKEEFISHLTSDLKYHDYEEREKAKFVTQDQFSTVKSIVYGMTGTILFAVLTSLMYLVIKR